MAIIAISGGFDPIHSGHIDMIENATHFGEVYVILNSDDWLKRKKGRSFMSWEERARIVGSIKGVSSVISVDDTDGTVCEALSRLKPTFFGNGGDRTNDNTPELQLCEQLGIFPIFNLGGGKTQSSSELLKKYVEKH